MVATHASHENASRPAKASKQIITRRHLPRQNDDDSYSFLDGNNKKDKFFISMEVSEQQVVSSDAFLTSLSNTTSVTSHPSESVMKQQDDPAGETLRLIQSSAARAPITSKHGETKPAHEGLIVSNGDILCGRGRASAFHPGNIAFRRFCWDFKEKYKGLSWDKRRKLAADVLDRVKATGARFLEMEDGVVYCRVSEARALEKVRQALREKKWKVENIVQDPTATPSFLKRTQAKPLQSDTPQAKMIEAGSRIEVLWPLDEKYYAAKVKDVIGNSAHLEYELDGVVEWVNLSEHKFRILS